MQTELFDSRRDSPEKIPAWEDMRPEERAAVIAALARLMAAAVAADARRKTDE